MNEDTAVAVPQSRRRIIERPRLTRMLDASSVRVRTLIAPAGYGKTTLARQWTGTPERPAVWYVGGPASADVAALAAGIAKTGSELLPGCDNRIRQRLSVTKRPEDEVDVLAEIVSEDLAGWPEGTWLVLDEYQFAAESPPADEFMGRVVDATSMPILIASRTRPGWATARKILYGEILELGRNALAMNAEEAHEALGARGNEAPGLVALADGWPAVIGLAAVAAGQIRPDDLPSALYEFFADELYQDLDAQVQANLCKLALVPSIDRLVASEVIGSDVDRIVGIGLHRGILVEAAKGGLEFHPLLREFFKNKLRGSPFVVRESVAKEVGAALLGRGLFDEAFWLGVELNLASVVEEVIRAGLDEALNKGRSATLRQWLDAAQDLEVASPIVDVAAAELSFREGAYFRAESLACRAASMSLKEDPSLATRALCLAGRAAHLASQDERALALYRQAASIARSDTELESARLGELSCAVDLELEESVALLEDLASTTSTDPARQVQIVRKRLILEMRFGAVRSVPLGLAVSEVVEHVPDPLGRTSFLNVLGHALALAADYEMAMNFATRLLADAETHRLEFVIPYGESILGMCHAGMREFDRAEEVLRSGVDRAERYRDGHGAWNCRAILARTLVAKGEAGRAIEVLSGTPAGVTVGLALEISACRAMAEACFGESDAAMARLAGVESATRAVEPAVVAACTRAVIALTTGSAESRSYSRAALAAAIHAGNLDALVCAYRGVPQLALELLGDPGSRNEAIVIMTKAGDERVVAIAGAGGSRGASVDQQLTARELEIQSLLAQGLTNKEIARRLYISEATVKVHVRHVLAKLGVRSRTAAALRSSTGLGYAAPATGASEVSRRDS